MFSHFLLKKRNVHKKFISKNILKQSALRFFGTSQKNHQPFHFPSVVDLNIIGRCNLNCTWCWGPDHNAKEPVTLDQWKNLLTSLEKMGTKSVIFTGGEPLIKKWLPDLARHAHTDLGLRTTLSTNGILLKEKASLIMSYIDDIGIPLDGHIHQINKIMRKGNANHTSKKVKN